MYKILPMERLNLVYPKHRSGIILREGYVSSLGVSLSPYSPPRSSSQHAAQIRSMAARVSPRRERRTWRDQLPQHPRHAHLCARAAEFVRDRRGRQARTGRAPHRRAHRVDYAPGGTDCVYQWLPVLFTEGDAYLEEHERYVARCFVAGVMRAHWGHSIDYGGISASRLEVLEERLRDDVVQELNSFGGRSANSVCSS